MASNPASTGTTVDESGPPDAGRRVELVLRAVLIVQIGGYLAGSWLGESPVVEFLYFAVRTSESAAVTAGSIVGLALSAVAVGTMIRPGRWYLYPTAAWFLGVAFAEAWLGGAPFAGFTPVADAVRWSAPLALAWMVADDGRLEAPTSFLLRYAAVATFAVHGIEALGHHPRFLDYLFAAAGHLDVRLAESTARRILTAIGGLDLLVAGLFAVPRRWRLLAAWMAFWASVAAAARTVHSGWTGLPETLVRAANGGIPLALLVAWWYTGRRDEASDASDQ